MKFLTFVLANLCTFSIGSGNPNLRFKKGSPIIGVSSGFLDGKLFSSRQDRLYYGFRGIPFAQPPERFKDSEPVKKWDGFKNAKEVGTSCPQIGQTNEIIGDDDCLFLNVYFPKDIKYETLVPVLVYIDGREFVQGGGHNFRPDYFMDDDVVLVTVNYRVGALGFLSTDDDEVTGNMGMKDLVLALKWVQKEIRIFGGDPNKVTIFGHGSGGSAVHYLILSPLGKGLFQNAISQSGSALQVSAFQSKPWDTARKLGERLNCSLADSTSLVDCLRSKTTAEIVTAQSFLANWQEGSVFRFAPSVDKNSPTPFLPDKPYQLIVSGKHSYVNWIIGGNADDGLQLTQEIVQNDTLLRRLRNEWSALAPDLLEYRNSVQNLEELDSISNQIWNSYFSESDEIGIKTLGNLIADRHYWLGYKMAAFFLLSSRHLKYCL